jgi:hypothetical protein
MRAAVLLFLLLGCRFGGPAPAPAPVTVPADAAVDRPAESDASADALAVQPVDAAPAPDGCVAPAVPAVCDPVCNTGCPALSRCDVAEGNRTGACVGIWITGEGDACFKGSGTDACAVKLTCVDGRCRRLCYRDGDCTAGSCCNQELPSGFKICAVCPGP